MVLRRPAAAVAPPECPAGHRSLELQDLAVGKNVMYISPWGPVFVNNNAAVGVEATGAEKAAVGAVGSAGIASATLAETYCPSETVVDADNFLRNEVVGWMSSLEAVGPSLPEALDAALAALGKTPEDMVQAFKVKVPWLPCVNFQAVPKCSKKGTLHISMLSYRPASYAANGMFVGDAKLLLGTGVCWSRSQDISSETPRTGEHDMLGMGTWRVGGE